MSQYLYKHWLEITRKMQSFDGNNKLLIAIVLLVCVQIAANFSIKDNLVVTTESGNLVGSVRVDRKGAKFFSFTSIPYAKSPVGELRFMVRIIQYKKDF